MRTLKGWFLTAIAMACANCVPTITVKNDANGACVNATVKDKFSVPASFPVALWRVDNKCGKEVAVEVKNLTYNGVSRDPLACKGHPPLTSTKKKGWIACVVAYDLRERDPYKYEVWVGGKMILDPQVVLKKDNGGR